MFFSFVGSLFYSAFAGTGENESAPEARSHPEPEESPQSGCAHEIGRTSEKVTNSSTTEVGGTSENEGAPDTGAASETAADVETIDTSEPVTNPSTPKTKGIPEIRGDPETGSTPEACDASEYLTHSSTEGSESDVDINSGSESEVRKVKPSQSPHVVKTEELPFRGADKSETYVDEADSFGDPTSTSLSMHKMAYFLQHGSESQQTVVLFELQQLILHCFEETVEVLVPVLCECIPHRSEELQLSASEAFADIVQQAIPPRITRMIADMAFQIIETTCTEDSFEAWGEILVIVLPEVKWDSESEVERILQTVDEFSMMENEGSRKLAARILGSLSASIKTEELKKEVMVRAIGMLYDKNVEVRGMVAESFSFIGADLDLRLTEKTLWPQLLALMNDPDARIHAACLRSIAHILEAKRDEARKSSLLKKLLPPMFAKECAFARKAASADQRTVDDDSYLLLEIMAEVFGPFLYTLYPLLSEDVKKEAFKAFLAMCTCNGPIIRRYCAFNLPGVALSLQGTFGTELVGVVEFLSRDSDSETRWNLAAGIHKTSSILMSKHSVPILHKAAIALIQDENPLVRMNALENLSELVQALHLTSDAEKWSSSSISLFFKSLIILSEGNWRTQELLAKQLKEIADLVPHQCLKENVLPLLYQMAEEGAQTVRKEAMAAISKAIWCIPVPIEREEVLENFFLEWGQGGVYWMRIAFIDCAQEALKFFSNDLFSYLFLPAIYQLARDNVPNVRLRVARMLHQLAPFHLHDEEFQKTLAWFKEDLDPDVKSVMDVIDMKIRKECRSSRAYRKRNEGREEAEAKLEENVLLAKGDTRRKGTKAKMRASAILPMIANKAGHLSPRLGRENPPSLSPVSVSSGSPSPRTSPSRLSSMLSGSNGKNKDSGKSSQPNGLDSKDIHTNGESTGTDDMSPRKSWKHILSLASPRRTKRDLSAVLDETKPSQQSHRK